MPDPKKWILKTLLGAGVGFCKRKTVRNTFRNSPGTEYPNCGRTWQSKMWEEMNRVWGENWKLCWCLEGRAPSRVACGVSFSKGVPAREETTRQDKRSTSPDSSLHDDVFIDSGLLKTFAAMHRASVVYVVLPSCGINVPTHRAAAGLVTVKCHRGQRLSTDRVPGA